MKFIKSIFLVVIIFLLSTHLLQAQAQWANTLNGQGDYSDRFNAVMTDVSGNIYLAGTTVRTTTEHDILVVKLNPSGDTVWTNIYNGPGNGTDDALAMALDAAGNVYVTGYQRAALTGTDIVTIKYNNLGVQQWLSTYTFVKDQYDQANSIAVDASGNVYITGLSDSDPSINTNNDYVTIKYNSAGIQQWASRMNGSGNGTDEPSKIALDPNGNPVVTGRSDNVVNYDYYTIKYNAADGAKLWSAIVDRTHNDWATDLVIHPSNGNVYVTGRSKAGDYDYATVCYNSVGAKIWTAIYNKVDDDRATNIALDSSGNVYVTGQSDVDASGNTNFDITTIKYNTSGSQQWVKTYSGAVLNDDVPTSLFVDATGNLFVAGSTDTDASAAIVNDFITLAYNTSGTLLWSQKFADSGFSNDVPLGITADLSGNVIVTGYTEVIPQKNGATLKYNSSGAIQWTKYYDGKGDNNDVGRALAIDANNNVFVAGYINEYNADRNFSLQKISPSGNTLWIKTLNGSSIDSRDEARAVTIDPSGNIFVAGYTHDKGYSSDFTLAKFNQAGDTAWVKKYDYINESDKAFAIGIDGNNGVYLAGRSDGDASINSNDDALTVKYTNNGIFQWAVRYNGTGNGADGIRAMKVTNSGNVYVAGKTFNGNNTDYLLIKYNSAGQQQWASFYDGGGDDECGEMSIDNLENIYLSGNSALSLTSHTDIATVKYNSSGQQQWAKRYSGNSGGNDLGTGITLDQFGNVIVSGTTDTDTAAATLNNDICVIKYDNNGNQQWLKLYNGLANANDESSDVGVDDINNIYIIGKADNSIGSNQNYDYVTIKYLQNGTKDTVLRYNGTGNSEDVPNSLLVKGSGIYLTGGSTGSNSQLDMLTLRYDGTVLSIESEKFENKQVIVYPNPFTDYTNLEFQKVKLSGNNLIILKIYDVTGRMLRELSFQNTDRVIINRNELESGTYFLEIIQDNKNLSYSKLIIN